METLKLKKLASVPSEDSFESSTSKHFIVEDGGELKRLSADSVGSEPFVVTFSGLTSDNTAACDKTIEEIRAAYFSGRQILFKYMDGSSTDLQINSLYVSESLVSAKGFALYTQNPSDMADAGFVSYAVEIRGQSSADQLVYAYYSEA